MLSNWKEAAVYAVIGAAGFWLGTLATDGEPPSRSLDHSKSLDAIAEHQGKESTKAASITRIEAPTIKIVRRTIRVPDGTITTEEERNESGGLTNAQTTAESRIEYRDREKVVYKDRETVRIERPALPTWSLSLQAGASLVEPLVSLPAVSRSVLGLTVERRLFGPFNAGVWVNSVGAGGVSIGARW